jgi:hypothetical protein
MEDIEWDDMQAELNALEAASRDGSMPMTPMTPNKRSFRNRRQSLVDHARMEKMMNLNNGLLPKVAQQAHARTSTRAPAVTQSAPPRRIQLRAQRRPLLLPIGRRAVCRAAQCRAVACSAVQRSAAQRSAVNCSGVPCRAVPCCAMSCSAAQCSALQCSAVQCS